MRNLALVTVLLFPFAAQAEEKGNIPSQERLQLLRNCCVMAPQKEDASPLGNLKRENALQKVVRERRILLFAVDPARPEDGRLDIGKHGKTFGLIYKKETGVLEDPF